MQARITTDGTIQLREGGKVCEYRVGEPGFARAASIVRAVSSGVDVTSMLGRSVMEVKDTSGHEHKGSGQGGGQFTGGDGAGGKKVQRQKLEAIAKDQGYEDSDLANVDDDDLERAFGGALKKAEEREQAERDEADDEDATSDDVKPTKDSPEQDTSLQEGALQTIVPQLTPRAQAKIKANLKGIHFAASREGLAKKVADDVAAIQPERLREAFRKQTEKFFLSSHGLFHGSVGKLYLASDPGMQKSVEGMTKDDPATFKMNTSSSESIMHELVAHEIGHVVDGPNYEFSGTPEWKAIHESEVEPKKVFGFGGVRLSKIANQDRREGFAELFRIANSSRRNKVAKAFPKATAFFQKNGLWPAQDISESLLLEVTETKDASGHEHAADGKFGSGGNSESKSADKPKHGSRAAALHAKHQELKQQRVDAYNEVKGDAQKALDDAGEHTRSALKSAFHLLSTDAYPKLNKAFTELDELCSGFDVDGLPPGELFGALKEMEVLGKRVLDANMKVKPGTGEDDLNADDIKENDRLLTSLIKSTREGRQHLKAYVQHRREMRAIKSGEPMEVRECMEIDDEEFSSAVDVLEKKDAEGHEHKGSGEGGGQFTSSGEGSTKSAEKTKRSAPGSQMSEDVKKKLRDHGMVGTFPPAEVLTSAIKYADLQQGSDQLKYVALMSWDQHTKSGRISRQYRYTQDFHDRNAAQKFERVKAIEPHIKNIEKTLTAQMNDESLPQKSREAAAIASAIRETGLRPTDSAESVEHGHFGISSIQARHCKVVGDEVHLDFIGKEGVRNQTTIREPANVAFLKNALKSAKGDQFVFQKASSDDAGDALKDASKKSGGPEDIKIKDLRTLKATQTAYKLVDSYGGPPPPLTGNKTKDVKAVQKAILSMSGEVAKVLNNTPTQARDNYIHPEVWKKWQSKIQSAS